MLKSLKAFFVDYKEVLKVSNKWVRKHWKGYIVLMTIPCLVTYAYTQMYEITYFVNDKIDKIKKHFSKEEES